MATKQGDILSSAQANRVKIETGRGTLHSLNDPRNQAGLQVVSQAVEQQLVEEAGYVKVRNTGTREVIFMHSYWMPGEVRVLHPGDFQNLQKQYGDVEHVSFEQIETTVNMAEAHDAHVAQVSDVMGNYFIGEKQAAVIDLGLLGPATKEELAAERKAADKRDQALEDRALKDAKRPETKTDAQKAAEVDAAQRRSQEDIVAEKERSAAAASTKIDTSTGKPDGTPKKA